VIEALKQHRVRQLEVRLKAGKAWSEKDLVFCDKQGGYIFPNTLSYQFSSLLQAAGLPRIRFHDLRRSAATILRVHPKVVQELLGHSSISMTVNIYSHILPSMQQEAMNKLDDIFRQQS